MPWPGWPSSDRVITFGVENQTSSLLPNPLESEHIGVRGPVKISPHLVWGPETVAWEESDCPSHGFTRGRAEARIWNSGPCSFHNSRGSGGKQLRAQTLEQAGLGPEVSPAPASLLCDLGQVSQHLCSFRAYTRMRPAVRLK